MGNDNIVKILGDLEKEIMDMVWGSSTPVTVREVLLKIGRKRKIAYTTVMTIMTRLTNKGLLSRKSDGSRAYAYQAVYSKDKFLTKVSKQIIKNFVASFGQAAVAHFTQEIEKIPTDKKCKLLKMLKSSNK